MAGSDEFKKELSQAARNQKTREEIGNDPERLAERLSIVDRDKYDFDGFTDKQINMALQGDKFGDEDYARLTGDDDFNRTEINNSGIMGDNNTQIKDSFNNNEGIIGDNNQQFRDSGNVFGFRAMGGFDNVNVDDSLNAEDITATIGKRGDINTSIGDGNVFGDGASIGNDNSVTVGSQMFGSALSLPRRQMAEDGAFAGLRFN